MAGSPSDSELELGEAVEREGHETLLPSVTRSVLSTKSYVASELEAAPSASGSVVPMDPDTEPQPALPAHEEARRGARSGDVIGGRYVVEGQLGRGGMGRVMRV